MIESLFKDAGKRKARIALFMSGFGSNAAEILALEDRLGEKCPFEIIVLVTNNSNTDECNAQPMGAKYHKPLVQIDAKKHYWGGGLEKVTLDTEHGRHLRSLYTERLRQSLSTYKIDFAAFCGFDMMTNIVEHFPCINVHPGDLTYLKKKKPYLTGLHHQPIMLALKERLPTIRSSVALLNPYDEENLQCDDGPVLALGPEMSIDYSKVPEDDFYAKIYAEKLQQELKRYSDHFVLPRAVQWFAEGRFGKDGKKHYFMTEAGAWMPCPVKVRGDMEWSPR